MGRPERESEDRPVRSNYKEKGAETVAARVSAPFLRAHARLKGILSSIIFVIKQ